MTGTVWTSDDGKTWRPAVPIGWQEEHNRLARFLFWVRGVGHCGKKGRRDR